METGTGLTKQAFGILGKCREVDQLLRDDLTVRSVIREIHPEVCFWAFGGGKPMKHYKKDDAGFRERLDVLKRDPALGRRRNREDAERIQALRQGCCPGRCGRCDGGGIDGDS